MAVVGRACGFWVALASFVWFGASRAGAQEGKGTIPGPEVPHITLKARDRPFSEVLEEFQRQARTRVQDQTDTEKRISLDLDKVPFWQALDALAQSAESRVDVHHRDGLAIVPRPGWHRHPPVSFDGLFRTTLKRVLVSHDLETNAASSTLVLEVAWLPSLEPFYLESRPQAFRLRSSGRDLGGPAGSSFADVDGRRALVIEVPVAGAVEEIDRVEGKLSIIGPSKMLAFEFPTLDVLEKAGQSATREGVNCKMTRVTLRDNRWSVSVVLDYPPGNRELDSYQSWAVNNDVVLVSTKEEEKRVASDSYVIEQMTSRQARITYHFLDPRKRGLESPARWKVTYRTPARVVEIPFRFTFQDVKLP